MKAHHHITIEYDGINQEWRANLGDEVQTTLVCKTLIDLEHVLDELERQGRLPKETGHVVFDAESWRTHRHR